VSYKRVSMIRKGNAKTCLFLHVEPIGDRRVRSQTPGLFLERLVAHVMVLVKGCHDVEW
jgi:hypothetical protein